MNTTSREVSVTTVTIEGYRPERKGIGVFSIMFIMHELMKPIRRHADFSHWWPHTGNSGPHRDPGATSNDGKPRPGWYRP